MAFVNDVKFQATTAGVVDFGIGEKITGFQLPLAAQAVDGTTYPYTARIGAQFESGHGAWNAALNTIARTTVQDSSAGYGVKVNFTSRPVVILTVLASDLAADAPPGISIETLGASPSASASVNDAAIQAALNIGGQLWLTTPGTYAINAAGALKIGNNTRIEFAPGVELVRSSDDCNMFETKALSVTPTTISLA